jgi:hypothetical protein
MNARVLAPQCRVRSTAALTKKRDYISISEISEYRALKKRLYFNIHIQYLSEYQNGGAHTRHWRPTVLIITRPIAIYIYLYLYVVSPE